jgi:hypothetical protein
MACPPLTLTVPDGGTANASIAWVNDTPGGRVSLHLSVRRNWVDVMLGSGAGDGTLTRSTFGSERFRLQPGDHVLSFYPGAAYTLTLERSVEGLAAVENLYTLDAGDLVLSTPYYEEQLGSIRSEQSRSVRWFWHAAVGWRALVRYTNDSWGFIEWIVDDGPWLAGDSAVLMNVSNLRGIDITLEADRDYFDPLHVGALWELTHAGQRVTKSVTAADEWTDPIRVTGVDDARKFQVLVNGSFTATVTLQRSVGTDYSWADVGTYAVGTHQIDDGFDNAIMYYRLGVKAGDYTSGTPSLQLIYAAGETTGVMRLTEYVDAQEMKGDVITPFASIEATRAWQEGAWSPRRGYPAAGALFDGRLWCGAGIALWASTPDGFDSFEIGENDADAISRLLAVGDGSPLVWIRGAQRLQIGTNADVANIEPALLGDPGTIQVRSSALDEPITPTNMTARGSAVRLVFADASGWRLRRVMYDLETNQFVTEDLNRLNDEIGYLGGGFVDLTASQRPRTRVWAPRADGQVAVLTLIENDAVVGWSRLLFDGEATAVTATPGVFSFEYDQDFTHLVMERTVDGVLRRQHERIEAERWRNTADAWHLENALQYAGEAASVFTGLDHLLGQDVLVWGSNEDMAGGAQFGPFTVGVVDDEGGIGVDISTLAPGLTLTRAIIGQEMRTRYMSGKLPYGAQAGSAVGEPKKVDHVTVLFFQTALGGVKIGIGNGEDTDGETGNTDAVFESPIEGAEPIMWRVTDLVPGFTTDDGAKLFSGEIKVTVPQTHHIADPRILFEFDGAAPAAILGYVVNMTTNES